jgi:hypothetical protein
VRACTPKQEAYAVGRAKGLSQADAYRAAYDVNPRRTAEQIGQEASKLEKVPHVKARVAELKKRVRVKVKALLVEPPPPPPPKAEDIAAEPVLRQIAIDTASVLFENARIGFSDVRRLLTDQGTLKPASEWDDDMAAAVSSIKVHELFQGVGKDREVIGQAVEIKLWDKGAALDRMGKHLGLYEKDNAQKAANLFDGLPRPQVKAILEALARGRARPLLG